MYKSEFHYTLVRRGTRWYYWAHTPEGKRIRIGTGALTKKDAVRIIDGRIARTVEDRTRNWFLNPEGQTVRRTAVTRGILMEDFCAPLFIRETCPITAEKVARSRTRSYSTQAVERHRHNLDRYILPDFGKTRVREITRRAVNDWLVGLPSRYGIKNDTANKALHTFRLVLAHAVETDVAETNHAQGVQELPGDTGSGVPFTEDEIRLLFSEPWEDSRLAYVMCHLAAVTGMRIGEIRALTPSQMDKERHTIRVDASISEKDGRKCTKTGAVREVYVPSRVWQELKDLAGCVGRDELVFSLGKGIPITKKTVYNALERRMAALGIPKDGRTFHSFRHFTNTYLQRKGVSKDKAKLILGHSTDEMSERYLHLSMEDIGDVKELLEEL